MTGSLSENPLGLPFRLRARKERALSGEAADKIRMLAARRPPLADVDVSKLCVVLRKYDSSGGYGLLDRRAFDLAMRELDVNRKELFAMLDVSKTGRCDAEIVIALCRHWSTARRAEEQPPEESDDDDVVLAQRLASTPLRRTCARLDVDHTGSVSRNDLGFALADSGLATYSEGSLDKYLVDGTFQYVDKTNPRDLGEAGEAYWNVRDRLVAIKGGIDSAVLFEELGKRMVLSSADRATLWQDLSSSSPTVAIDKLDRYFAPWKPFSRLPPAAERERRPAPFAEEDLHPPIQHPKRVLRKAPRSVGDESYDVLLPGARLRDLEEVASVQPTRHQLPPPPYWTIDSVAPSKPNQPLLPPQRPYHTEFDGPDSPAARDIPSLALKLRNAINTTTDSRIVRSALRVTGEDASRGSLQSLAQYLGVAFNNGELEQLCRWVDTRPFTSFPVSSLLDIKDNLPPSLCSTAQQTEDEPLEESDQCSNLRTLTSATEEIEEEHESIPEEDERREMAILEEEEYLPDSDAPTTTCEPVSSSEIRLLGDEQEEEEPHPPPPPPTPPPELATDDDARNSLSDKLASAPALASRKACALRLRHAFRRRAAQSYSSPLVMTARGGELQTSDPFLSTPGDVASALRELGVDISPHELRVLIADVQREEQADETNCHSQSPDAHAEVPVGAVLARLISLSRLHHLRRRSTFVNH